MKKLISALLVFTLLCVIAVFAQASMTEADIVGKWVYSASEETEVDNIVYKMTMEIVLYFNADKTCRMQAAVDCPELPEVNFNETAVGTWCLAVVDGVQGVKLTGDEMSESDFLQCMEDGTLNLANTFCFKKVSADMTDVMLDKVNATMYQRKDTKNRDTLQLKVIIPSSESAEAKVTWKSSKTGIAKVDANGLVTAIKAGTTVITATVRDGDKTSAATCKVTVKKVDKPVTKITAKPKKLTLKSGDKASVSLTFKPAGVFNNKVKWSTSDKKIATVSKTGVITAKKAGKCVITATATDGTGKKVNIKLTVK